jgi:hypothetical protein
MKEMNRGTAVTIIAYRGKLLQRRVWEDSGQGVMVCSEEAYQHALMTGEEPLCSGFPKRDIVKVINEDQQGQNICA